MVAMVEARGAVGWVAAEVETLGATEVGGDLEAGSAGTAEVRAARNLARHRYTNEGMNRRGLQCAPAC